MVLTSGDVAADQPRGAPGASGPGVELHVEKPILYCRTVRIERGGSAVTYSGNPGRCRCGPSTGRRYNFV
jgi:hypothetical protein